MICSSSFLPPPLIILVLLLLHDTIIIFTSFLSRLLNLILFNDMYTVCRHFWIPWHNVLPPEETCFRHSEEESAVSNAPYSFVYLGSVIHVEGWVRGLSGPQTGRRGEAG